MKRKDEGLCDGVPTETKSKRNRDADSRDASGRGAENLTIVFVWRGTRAQTDSADNGAAPMGALKKLDSANFNA
jgi:hypothetical protein